MTQRTLLIDADIFAFAAASVTQGTWQFDEDGPPCIDADLEGSLRKAEADIEKVANKLKATKVIVCLTDTHNFRLDVWDGYKGNRKNVVKPVNLQATKDFFKTRYETYQRPGLEADDCMGILSTHPTLLKGEKIIVSEDKDMKTIPGLLFNPAKHDKPVKVSALDADRYFMEQTLTGDSTDGYPGCRGIGPKSPFVAAVREAKSLREMWAIVKEGFESKGFTEPDAVHQARMARILRHTDGDFAGKRRSLGHPPFN